ncbi:hypothetical protein LdCL_280030000 [Leishmania donovani]|uniref:Leucine-rich repeat-containing N-terminal plant-type domain-containing protein n=1 Tax=Leishmania donovani TaxID=5661 RepID=A0A3Q8IQT2_LEIDO|nr:hypothetical protein LdCL_280030000 [Leishmania donovani]
MRPLRTASNYCAWDGVTCNSKSYAHVSSSGHMLVDEMPKVDGSDYGALPRVALIVLSNNSRIHGGLADSLTAPKRLRSLEVSRKSVHWNLPSR